jgi:hypothetical protein
MRPTVAPLRWRDYPPVATDSLPEYCPTGARLEAGYVRYVCILPALFGDSTDTIRCKTRISRSGPGTIPYLALSYAWGDPTPKHSILIDGEQRLVAENLWHFLCEAKTQPVRFSCWLWIDALSIDQSDTEERRHQVGDMSTIFRNAFEVVVWLGQGCECSDLAMLVLSSVVVLSSGSIYQRSEKTVRCAVRSTGGPSVTPSAIDEQYAESNAIVNLCQRPFWKRLWVFQELRHAEDICLMCGERTITWTDFRNLWSVMTGLRGLNDDIAQALRNSLATRMMTLRTKPMDFSLWNLLKETRSLECADEHDRVYALLSVANEGHEDIEADYHASLSSLGHSILRNKYASRRPRSLDDVKADCDFLREILKMNWGDMIGYGDLHWGIWDHYIGSRSPNSSWGYWAKQHRQPAVAKLLLDTK